MGELAAKSLAQEFGVEAVVPIAAEVRRWQLLPADAPKMHERHAEQLEVLAAWHEISDVHLERSRVPVELPPMGQVHVQGYRDLVARDAAAALKEIPGALSVLANELKSTNASSRAIAAAGLGIIKGPLAVEPLIEALGDSDATVVDVAFCGLTAITKQYFLFGKKNRDKWRTWWEKKNKGRKAGGA